MKKLLLFLLLTITVFSVKAQLEPVPVGATTASPANYKIKGGQFSEYLGTTGGWMWVVSQKILKAKLDSVKRINDSLMLLKINASEKGQQGGVATLGPYGFVPIPQIDTSKISTTFDNSLKQNKFIINVRDYGATGDGLTNDSASIQHAFDAVPTIGGTVFFPAGNYLSGKIYVNNRTTVVGENGGWGIYSNYAGPPIAGSIITNSSLTDTLFVVKATACQFSNLILYNTNLYTKPTSGGGIIFLKANDIKLTKILVWGFWDNIVINDGGWYSLTDSFLYNAVNRNLYISASLLNSDSGDYGISNCIFAGANTPLSVGISIDATGGIKIVNCKFISLNDCIDLPMKYSTSVLQITNCSFENFTGNGIRIRPTSSSISFNQIIINGNQLNSINTISGNLINISGPIVNNVLINNNILDEHTSTNPCIRIDNIQDIVSHSNIFFAGNKKYSITNTPKVDTLSTYNGTGTGTLMGNVTASKYAKIGGTSRQFQMADGSVKDSIFQPKGRYLEGNQTITLSGDATGSGATSITTNVAKIQGISVDASTPSTNDYLNYNGTNWVHSALPAYPTLLSLGAAPASGSGNYIQNLSSGTQTDARISIGGGANLGGALTSSNSNGKIINGTFDTDTHGWVAYISTLSVVSGHLRVATTSSGTDYAYQLITNLIVGNRYKLTYNYVGKSAGSAPIFVGTSTSLAGTGYNGYINGGDVITGLHTVYFTATSTNFNITLGATGTGNYSDWDDISLVEMGDGVFNGYVIANQYKLSALNTAPTSSTDTGTTGEIRFTTTGIFICTATNVWIKCVGATF